MMELKTAGILSPGDMGHVVGQVLRRNGLRVITCLEGRSERTRQFAAMAGIEDVGTYEDMVVSADIILSILVPAQARSAADRVAQAISRTKSHVLFADCNAIAPQTATDIGARIRVSGGRFVDASIIGPPPKKGGTTRFYASGLSVSDFEELRSFGLDVISLGDRIGDASAIKVCYASLTKGSIALSIELLTAARLLGVYDALMEEFQLSQKPVIDRIEQQLPGVQDKAHRWIGEMEEIAATFEQCGLTPSILLGAADIYRFVANSMLSNDGNASQNSLKEMIDALAKSPCIKYETQ